MMSECKKTFSCEDLPPCEIRNNMIDSAMINPETNEISLQFTLASGKLPKYKLRKLHPFLCNNKLTNQNIITLINLLDPTTMKTPTKKKAVKKSNRSSVPAHTLYELYRTKSGAWKFRKRARNGKILNHSYNSKALAIKGMKADFRLTKETSELKWKEVKK